MQYLLIPKLVTHWTGFQAAASLPRPSHLAQPSIWRGEEGNTDTALSRPRARRQQAEPGRLPAGPTAQPHASVDKRPVLASGWRHVRPDTAMCVVCASGRAAVSVPAEVLLRCAALLVWF